MRVPVTTQVTATECGLCCVASLLGAYGRHESLHELRADLVIGRDGSTVGQLAELLRSRAMQVRMFEATSVEALRVFDIPVIIFWEGYHFVILERTSKRGAVLVDPAMGRRKITWAELQDGFSGVILAAAPDDEFEPRRRSPLAEWRSFPLLPKGAGRLLALSLVFAVIGYAVTAAMPLALQWSVDALSQPDPSDRLWTTLTVAPTAILLYFALQALRTVLLSKTISFVGGHLMSTVFGHLLQLPYKFFSTRPVGELLYRLGSVTQVRDLLSTRIVGGALDVGIALILMSYVFGVAPVLGLITLAIFALSLALLFLTQRPLSEALDSEIAHLSKSQAVEYDAISSIAAIKMGGYSHEFFARWKKSYDASLSALRRRMLLQDGLVGGLLGAVQVFGPLALVSAGLLLTLDGSVSIGAAVAVQGVGALLLSLSSAIFGSWSEFVQACRLMRRVLDITETAPEASGTCVDELERPAISVERVGFAYAGGERVVKDVTIDVAPGEKVAIVGASGSGKSSLALVMAALHAPTDGRVRVGGTELGDWDLDRLRQQIGYVPQDVRLHDASIVDNLRLGTKLSKAETIERCLRLPFLDFLSDLPMGFETMVAEQGANFSGGQRQRIAIARALLRNPRIVILDEATSALDTITEQQVTRHLAHLGCTQVILAHRLSTIRACDRIYVLVDGRVAQSGTHDELLAVDGPFADLYRASQTDQEEENHVRSHRSAPLGPSRGSSHRRALRRGGAHPQAPSGRSRRA